MKFIIIIYTTNKLTVVEMEDIRDVRLRKFKLRKIVLGVRMHFHHITNKANRVLGMIRRTIRYKEQWMMTNLYKSLVRPHLECKGVRCPPIFALSNLINVGWL